MMANSRIFLSALFVLLATTAVAQKPKWVENTPQELNHTYKFVEVVSYATDIASAREESKKKLASNEQLVRMVQVNVETGKLRNVEQTVVNGKFSETIRDKVDVQLKVSGKQFDLQAYPVDEYITEGKGMVELHTLYMVAVEDNPVFDRVYLTTSYGAAPVFMSIVPGLGQWYKGSKVKGACLFGATALMAGVGIWCENERASYESKIKNQPKNAKTYKNKADNYETARNVCLAAAAAVWVYNLIDAATAKGARRVEVKRAGDGFAMAPFVTSGGAGVTLAYQF